MDTLFPGLSVAPDLHPMFVHFPIAFWLAAAVVLPLAHLRDDERMAYAGRLLLWLGTAAATVTIATGYLAANRMGHDSPGHEFVHVHRNFMWVASSIALVASGIAWRVRSRPGRPRWLLTAVVLVLGGVATLGADRGARLVFGYGMGVAPVGDAPADQPEGGHDHGNHAH